jgi:hypothetical protein
MNPAPMENVPNAAASSSHRRVLERGLRSDIRQQCPARALLPSPAAGVAGKVGVKVHRPCCFDVRFMHRDRRDFETAEILFCSKRRRPRLRNVPQSAWCRMQVAPRRRRESFLCDLKVSVISAHKAVVNPDANPCRSPPITAPMANGPNPVMIRSRNEIQSKQPSSTSIVVPRTI